MQAVKVFRSPVWLLLHKLSSPHYRYIRKMRRGDHLPLTQIYNTATTCIMIFDWLNYEKKFSSEINGEFDM